MSVDHDLELQNLILPRVSRTFSLTIPQLPAGLEEVVANAYLLCRIADTIEDDPELDAALKSEFLAEFLDVIATRSGGETFSRRLAGRLSERTPGADRALVEQTAAVIRITSRFTAAQRHAILRCMRTMCAGMHEFESGKTLDGLPTLIDLDRYCYFVAGIVGETLTDLFCEHAPELNDRRDELMALSVCFGQGLQMTNILKDVWEDRNANTCWLPRSLFRGLEGGLSRAMRERDTAAITGGIEKLIGIAHTHLRAALRYTQLIPQHETGIRRFCLWAIGLALLTLRQIYTHPGYDNGKDVKISRRAVRITVLLCNIAQHSNRAVGWIFTLAGQGLPLADSLEYRPSPGARLASDRLT